MAKVDITHTYVLHSFLMGDVEDPELYAAEPIHQWQQTEQGKWCMENAKDVTYHIKPNPHTYGHEITITGELSGKHATYYALKKT